MVSRLHLLLLLLAIFIQQTITNCQIVKTPSYHVEVGSSASVGDETPFWLISNRYGLISPNKYNSWLKAGFKTSLNKTKPIDFDYGLDLVNRYDNRNKLYFNEGYARLKLWFINIQAGSKEEKFGNQDSSLSSGGLLWSGNARPMPKIAIYVPNFTAIPFTKGYFEFKGGISHGWFGDQPFAKNYYLHHKYGYIRFGGKLPVHLSYGMHHFAQWGGESSNFGKQPETLKDFVKIFFAKGGGSSAAPGDIVNRLGNHLGSRNFGLDIDFRDYKTGIYWQTIFEDGSGKAYRNISDGLWGIYLRSSDKHNLITGLVYEFIKTTNQSGPYNLNPTDPSDTHEYGGNDNYFNHWVYQAGWTYDNMTIGTPLITSPAVLHGDPVEYIRNNKVIAHHFAFEGVYNHLVYKLFYTYSLNYGTNYYPFSAFKSQHSVMLHTNLVNTLPWGIDLNVTLGMDKGKMYGNNVGIMISLVKSGNF